MEINTVQKIILINQYRILSKLYPEESDVCARNIEILEHGYKFHYDELNYMESTEMTEKDCKEVLDILEIYYFLFYSVQELNEKNDIDYTGKVIFFPGFDGNNETPQLCYTRFLLHTMDRFEVLHHKGNFPDYNTHYPVLPTYREMLKLFQSYDIPYHHNLSKQQTDELLKIAVSGSLQNIK